MRPDPKSKWPCPQQNLNTCSNGMFCGRILDLKACGGSYDLSESLNMCNKPGHTHKCTHIQNPTSLVPSGIQISARLVSGRILDVKAHGGSNNAGDGLNLVNGLGRIHKCAQIQNPNGLAPSRI